MSVIPGIVKSRARKEFNRGYSPKKMLKGFLGATLLVSVANAGNIKDGIIDWMGDTGGRTANAAEAIGGGVVVVSEIAIEGGGNAAENFGQEFDGDLPALPTIDISAGSQQAAETGSAVLNLSGACNSGTYSLANGPWGALEEASYSGSIPNALAQNPQVVAAAQSGAQTVDIICG